MHKEVLKRFKKKLPGYYYACNYLPEKYCWLGVVVQKKNDGKLLILTVGVELTKQDVMKWCEGVIENRKNGGIPSKDPPDMKDRPS